MNLLYKAVSGEGVIKDVDIASKTVTGYFSTFGVKDSDGDIVMPGAFKKTLRENGVKGKDRIMHLWQHSTWDILGKPKTLKEDKIGLYFETEFDTRRKLVEDVLVMYSNGTLNEHSIGFNIISSKDVVDKNGKRQHTELNELKLWEGSTVTWGANPDTPFRGFKAKDKPEMILELIERHEKFIEELYKGNYADETFHSIKLEAMKIADMIKSLEVDKPIEKITSDFKPSSKFMIDSFNKHFKN